MEELLHERGPWKCKGMRMWSSSPSPNQYPTNTARNTTQYNTIQTHFQIPYREPKGSSGALATELGFMSAFACRFSGVLAKTISIADGRSMPTLCLYYKRNCNSSDDECWVWGGICQCWLEIVETYYPRVTINDHRIYHCWLISWYNCWPLATFPITTVS